MSTEYNYEQEKRLKETHGPNPNVGLPGWIITFGVLIGFALAAGITTVSYLWDHFVVPTYIQVQSTIEGMLKVFGAH